MKRLLLALVAACALLQPAYADLIKQSTAFNRTVLMIDSTDHTSAKTGLVAASTLTATGGTTTTITTATQLAAGQMLVGATGTAGNIGQTTWVQSVSGTGPYTLTVSPALPNSPANNDTFTVSALIVKVSKNAGSLTTIFPVVSEIGSGRYNVALTTSHVNTLGAFDLIVTAAGADQSDTHDQVIAADLADAVRLGLTALPNANAAASGGLPTVNGSNQVAVSSVANAVSTTGNVLTVTDIANIWTQATSGISTAGSFGLLIKTNLDTNIGSRLATSGYTAAPTVAQIWGEALPGSYANGSAGKLLSSAGASSDPWSILLPGSYTTGTAGYLVGTNLNATVSSRMASGNVTIGGYAPNLDPATLVLGATASNWNSAGTIGQKINTSGSATDPWTVVSSGYTTSGTFGDTVRRFLDAQVSTVPANTVSALTLNGDWRKMRAALVGKYSFNPTTGLFTFYGEDNSTQLFTATITTTNGRTTARTGPN